MVFPMTGQPRDGAMTFAEPDENIGYAERAKRFYDNPPAAPGQPEFQYEGIGALPSVALDAAHDFIMKSDGMRQMFGAAERSQRIVDDVNSNQLSVEVAYDRRIKAVKEATGLQLDNPERYRMTERERRQLNAQGVEPADIPNYQRRLFDEKVAAARDAHPDKTEQLTFGNIDDEAKALAKGAEGDYEEARKTSTLSTPGSLLAQFAGGFVGSLRDPLMTGTMFAGPTTAAGKTVGARILSASWRQGLYNAGISALEQPSVQAWRTEVGVKSGVVPAVENVGMAFLFGAIPGAAFRAIHEIPGSLQPSVQRVLNGAPETGDIEKAMEAISSALKEIDGDIKPRAARASFEIKPIPSRSPDMPAVSIEMKGGGRVEIDISTPGEAQIFRADVPEDLRGQGRAVAMYEEAAKYAAQQGRVLKSDSFVSSSAVRVYEGLERRGYEVRKSPDAVADESGSLSTERKGPVFEVGAASQAPSVIAPVESRAARLGADMDAAELATRPPPAKDIPPQLHDDLTNAALRNADDPSKPSPQAVATVNAIEAWHGSRHNFEAFDASRIDTGQGAQSYGHGLYFAENRDVATSYRDTGMGSHPLNKGGVGGVAYDPNNPQHVAAYYRHQHGGRAAKELEKEMKFGPADIKRKPITDEALRLLKEKSDLPAFEPNFNEGTVYKVRIHADREHMLDWDKPLSEQTPYVQDALKRIIKNPVEGDPTGEQFMRSLGSGTEPQAAASRALHEAGIPGIKYLDQGSRLEPWVSEDGRIFVGGGGDLVGPFDTKAAAEAWAAKRQTRNFVIFDDKLIDITHKNDKPLSPIQREVEARIAEAQPQSRAEAEAAAHEALEDIGNRQANVQTREVLEWPTLPEPPEKIVDAAIRTDKGIFRGPTHATASVRAEDAGVDISKLNLADADGFLTSTGRFVSREEAATIADAVGQRTTKSDRLESSTVDYRKGDYEVVTREQAIVLRPDMKPNQLDAAYYRIGKSGTEAEGQLSGYRSLQEARKAAGLPDIEIYKPPPASSKDPLDKIPWSDGDGSPKMLSAQAAARQGEKETKFADIIRECK